MINSKDFTKLEDSLGLKFKNKELLKQAFVHRSYLNEHPDCGLEHNERLEFLGDAVLELVVTEYLYKNYPNPEGELTTWRAALVNSKMLSKVAQELTFNKYLFLSKGESRDIGRARQYILANTFEAFIGALYLDQGIKETRDFIKKHLLKELSTVLEQKLYLDPKSLFQEKAQEKVGITPTYEVLGEEGPDHAKIFTVGVFLSDEMIAKGRGPSKQAAQEEAARKAIEKKNWND